MRTGSLSLHVDTENDCCTVNALVGEGVRSPVVEVGVPQTF